MIYLQASPEVLKKRLRKKNSAAELSVSDDYIEEVVKAYEHFFFHYTSSDLLVVNTNDIDFVERHADLQELLRRISEPIRGTQYFLPLGVRGIAHQIMQQWLNDNFGYVLPFFFVAVCASRVTGLR